MLITYRMLLSVVRFLLFFSLLKVDNIPFPFIPLTIVPLPAPHFLSCVLQFRLAYNLFPRPTSP